MVKCLSPIPWKETMGQHTSPNGAFSSPLARFISAKDLSGLANNDFLLALTNEEIAVAGISTDVFNVDVSVVLGIAQELGASDDLKRAIRQSNSKSTGLVFTQDDPSKNYTNLMSVATLISNHESPDVDSPEYIALVSNGRLFYTRVEDLSKRVFELLGRVQAVDGLREEEIEEASFGSPHILKDWVVSSINEILESNSGWLQSADISLLKIDDGRQIHCLSGSPVGLGEGDFDFAHFAENMQVLKERIVQVTASLPFTVNTDPMQPFENGLVIPFAQRREPPGI